MLSDFAFWLRDVISDVAQFFIDMLLNMLDWIWSAFIGLLDTLPIASTVTQASSLFSAIPASVWYFMNVFQIPLGITFVLSGYLIRFLIRRLPIVG
ncbi:DUF2523 family protein [Pseudomonas syringae]|uniref:DUF2523 family protein n=1 Tax=Pseudomonas syringae TaxID=317 RepID=UPI0009EA3D8F|nr:DUF2523 family protein [Pseudomonas syringae]